MGCQRRTPHEWEVIFPYVKPPTFWSCLSWQLIYPPNTSCKHWLPPGLCVGSPGRQSQLCCLFGQTRPRLLTGRSIQSQNSYEWVKSLWSAPILHTTGAQKQERPAQPRWEDDRQCDMKGAKMDHWQMCNPQSTKPNFAGRCLAWYLRKYQAGIQERLRSCSNLYCRQSLRYHITMQSKTS